MLDLWDGSGAPAVARDGRSRRELGPPLTSVWFHIELPAVWLKTPLASKILISQQTTAEASLSDGYVPRC